MGLLSLWFGLRTPVSRRAYATTGFLLMAFKYGAEAALIERVTGRRLSPLDFLNPLLSVRGAGLAEHDGLVFSLALFTLPFLWIGVSMTLRRAEDAGHSPYLAVLYFVPVVNYLLMLTLCILPSRPRPGPAAAPAADSSSGSRRGLESALRSLAWGALLALGMVALSVVVFGSYGTVLFVATPFVMGTASAHQFNRPQLRSMGATLLVATGAVLLAGLAILLFALEGVLCLAMAAPLAVVLALMGALLGRALAARAHARPAVFAAMVWPLPLFALVDTTRPPARVREVRTEVEVDAPPEAVWPHVVAFAPLGEPPAWFFRLGVAYPRGATIAGHGVGAVRRCEFSTGAFVEPITTWEEPTRLAFGVSAQPPALRELSPYRHVMARHLDGYLRVEGGEFRLVPLAGGRTRLEGRTRYAMRIFPAAYWSLWSDALIHAIHERVLEQVRQEALRSAGRG